MDMAFARTLNYILQKKYLTLPTTSRYHNILNIVPNNVIAPNNVRQTQIQYSTKEIVSKNKSIKTTKNKVGFPKAAKESAKSAGYLAIVVTGVGITVVMFYTIFKELFSSKSPTVVYSKALDRCIKHPQVVDYLGAPIKAYGQETRRGRRNHVSHMYFIKDNVSHMRVIFYIQGTRRRGTVRVDMRENASGDYEYAYLAVTVGDHVIVIEDNRKIEV